VFEREPVARPGLPAHSSTRAGDRRPLYPVSRQHLNAMTGEIGLWQHARGPKPDPLYGYCTDDVSRLVIVDLMHSRELGLTAVDESIRCSVRFVGDAFDGATGRFRNFRSADGQWSEASPSEDCHARAMAGLGALMVELPGTDLADEAGRLFAGALPAVASLGYLRAQSAALLACDFAIEAGPATDVEPVFELLAGRLERSFTPSARAGTAKWPWPEPILTYENALVPRALIAAGLRLQRPAILALGCSVLDWLIGVQVGESGFFSPIGNKGWWPRKGVRSQFDQQPIEAAAMVAAASAAYHATGRGRYLEAAEAAYGWFLGDNDLEVALADPARGACFDGLTPSDANQNQGAESTLMWLTALEQMRDLRRSAAGGSGRAAVADAAADPGSRQ
jgi:hypothetical protein